MFPNLPSRGDGRRSSSHRAQGNGACEWIAVDVISSWVIMEEKIKETKVLLTVVGGKVLYTTL